jgi:hypothetical protein
MVGKVSGSIQGFDTSLVLQLKFRG